MIELNKKEQLIMSLLADTEQYYLSLIRSSKGELERRDIFMYLQSLKRKGLIESRKKEIELDSRLIALEPRLYKVNRTFYKLTDTGIAKSKLDSKGEL